MYVLDEIPTTHGRRGDVFDHAGEKNAKLKFEFPSFKKLFFTSLKLTELPETIWRWKDSNLSTFPL